MSEGPGRWGRFNLDSPLRVRLSPKGREILGRHATQLGWPTATPDQEGWVELKVLEIMVIFGGHHMLADSRPMSEFVVRLG